jgi:serine/threonine protein kinase
MHLVTETDVLFLVMPLAETDLFLEIYDNGAVSEQKGRDLIKQILSGLKYMHEKGFAHRDVKLENILIVGQKLKICDFDLTIKCVDENGKPIENKERRGTLEYMAPEVISGEGSIDPRLTDVWSCGILLFALLTYTYAFGPILKIGKNSQKVIENMKFGRYSYPKECLPSNECQSFISQFLQFDQYSRLTVNQLMDSNWFGLNLADSNDRTNPPQTTRSFSFASPLTSTYINTSSSDSSSSSSYDTE